MAISYGADGYVLNASTQKILPSKRVADISLSITATLRDGSSPKLSAAEVQEIAGLVETQLQEFEEEVPTF